MRTPTTAVIVAALAAIGAPGAQAQTPPQSYSMSTAAIARHVARDIVRTEICGLAPRPLPFAPPRSTTFDGMLLREQAMLERAMLDYGDDVVCACLDEGRVKCP